ncbi:MAG TPA: universal stress protein [Blastocatellia bacterium]|nr:universal stress protein [Blastocatellia bacterium]
MKIVLALDSSPVSEIIVNEFTSRPWPSGTVVRVLHVLPTLAWTPIPTFISNENDRAQAFVTGVAQRLQSKGFEASSEVVAGYADLSIVDYAKEWGADFIIIGSHGQGAAHKPNLATRFYLGSVAKSVVRHAHCCVEIVRASARQRLAEACGPMKILLATDGSEFSVAAARSVAERPWPEGSEVKIISVVDTVVPAVDPWYAAAEAIDQIRREEIKLSQEAVSTAERIISHMPITSEVMVNRVPIRTSSEVLTGVPRWRIIEEADEWGAHLVVVGSHGRRGVTRLLLGSVSETVAIHANCSVDVIRQRIK